MNRLRKGSRVLALLLCLIFVLSGCGSKSGAVVLSKAKKDEVLDAYYEYFKEHQNDYEGYEVGGMITVDKSGRPVMIMAYLYNDENNDRNDESTYLLCGYNYSSKSVELIEGWYHKKENFQIAYFSDGLICAYGYKENQNSEGYDDYWIYDGACYQLDNGKLDKIFDVLDGGDNPRVRLAFDNKSVEYELNDSEKYESELRDAYKHIYGSDKYYDLLTDTYSEIPYNYLDGLIYASVGYDKCLEKTDFQTFINSLKGKEWHSQEEYWQCCTDIFYKLYDYYAFLDLWEYKMKLNDSWFNNFEFIKDLNNEEFKEFLKELKYPYPEWVFDDPFTSDLREIVDAKIEEIAANNTKSNYEKLSEYLKWYATDYTAQEKEIIQKYEK